MLGPLELELGCLWINNVVETYKLSKRLTQTQLSDISERVNRQLRGSFVVIRPVGKLVFVIKYPPQVIEPKELH